MMSTMEEIIKAERELWDLIRNQNPFDEESAAYLAAKACRLQGVIGDVDRVAAVTAAANDRTSPAER
jgi:hypothetical protein